MVDIPGLAREGQTIVTEIEKVEPWVAGILPIIIPGAAPAIPLIQAFAPVILTFAARALGDIATANGGDLPSAMIELFQHLSKGQPNSPTLSATVTGANESTTGSG